MCRCSWLLKQLFGKLHQAQNVGQVCGGPLPLAKVELVGLNSHEHKLEILFLSVEWCLNDHFWWFVIRFPNYLSRILVGVELLQSTNECKEFFLDLHIASFGICQHVVCIHNEVVALQWDLSKLLRWCVPPHGDALCRVKPFENWSIGNQLFCFVDCTIMKVGPDPSYSMGGRREGASCKSLRLSRNLLR